MILGLEQRFGAEVEQTTPTVGSVFPEQSQKFDLTERAL